MNEACSLQGGGVSRLRQACVHPSLAMPRRKRRKRKRGVVEEPKAVATMEETLWRLVEDAQLKAEESQRETVVPPLRARGSGEMPRRFGRRLCCSRL